jgi:methylated-DNA-[protein]-cysteine S-methyltransferase
LLVAGGSDARTLAALGELGAHLLPPVAWRKGWATLHLLVEDGTDIAELIALFPEAELLAKARASGSAWLLGDVTPKQAQAVLAAHAAGYYAHPRRADARDVGRRLGLGRSALGERLARAEGAMVSALLPVLRMRADSTAPPSAEVLALHSAFSRELGLYVNLHLRRDAVARVTLSRSRPAGADGKHPFLADVLRNLRAGAPLDHIPVELGGSDFERAVWGVLRAIPRGSTMTYAEVATRVRRPGGAQAVGQACGRNPVPLIIPCHRVVRADGASGGYAAFGGARTKEKLLALERKLR